MFRLTQPTRLPLQDAEFAAEDSGHYTNCKVLLEFANLILLRLRFRQRQRGLAKDVAPARWRTNIRIAKP
jgi:hypothetical protein